MLVQDKFTAATYYQTCIDKLMAHAAEAFTLADGVRNRLEEDEDKPPVLSRRP